MAVGDYGQAVIDEGGDIPAEVEIDGERLVRLVSIAFATLKYVGELMEEPGSELRAQRQQQRVRERFMYLVEELEYVEDGDLNLPWLEDAVEDDDE